jgi:hypothetical protein
VFSPNTFAESCPEWLLIGTSWFYDGLAIKRPQRRPEPEAATALSTGDKICASRLFHYQGRRHVGLVSSDGQSITPFDLTPEQAQKGALQALIEAGRPRKKIRLARQPLSP